jgi:cytochrome b pre-mRNA-processing protein 3
VGPRARVLVVLAVIVGTVASWLWLDGETRRGLRALPAPARQEVYRRDLEAFRSLCRARRIPELDAECRERARFLLAFPECDARCRAELDGTLPGPTR